MRKRGSWLAAVVVSLTVLLIGACGDDDGTATPTSVGATPTAATAAPTATVAAATATATAVAPTPTSTPPAAATVDACTLRLSIEGQPLTPGPSFALDALRWQICVGGAAAGSSEKLLFKSEDGGASWTLLSTTTLGNPTPEAGVGHIPNGNAAEVIYFLDDQHGWLGLSSPGVNLYRTDNSGANWTAVPALDPGVPVLSITFTDSDHGTLTTPDGPWTTANAGATWTAAP
jgi:hypothetical protein